MLNELEYPKTLEYSSDGAHLPIEFFMLTVPLCKRIDLKLGYFSSNAIRTLAYGFAQFIHNGGHLRIITNHFLSYKDKMLLVQDEEENNVVAENEIKNIIENDLEGLAELLENGDQHFYNCLKYLLKNNRLEIIPVKLKPDKLAHYKQGIMDDGTNQVYFNGSCNFTYKGLIDNGESLGIARSWGEISERLKIQENIESIDRICKKEDESFKYLSADQITEVIFTNGQDKDLDELIEDELSISERLASHPKLSKPLKNYIKTFRQKIETEKQKKREESQKPKFPYAEGPRDYQKKAYEKWVSNNFKGIFAMATGTGKTITSLNCALEKFNEKGRFNLLILVPSIALVNQWEGECRKFNFRNIVKVSSKCNWEGELNNYFLKRKLGSTSSIIIIATYSSFVRPRFIKFLKLFETTDIMIADEAHNMGASSILKVLPEIKQKLRIGLSATPERQYDDFGNNILREFFDSQPPYTFNYSMAEAIENKVLCQYYYFPHIVQLTDNELEEYEKITKQLAKYYSIESDSYAKNEIVEILLLKRKRIIHKAQNKLITFKQLLKDEFERKRVIRNALVYVPEGDITEEIPDDPDFHINLLNRYTKVVRDIDRNITVTKFTAETKNREEILRRFSSGDIKVLTSMKCLDEGVDIPQTELAFFCASTGNPKQFIQRRGRVLRCHEGKDFAFIHDLVVIPSFMDENDENFKMKQSIVKKELERVVHFSFLAINKYHTFEVLDGVCKNYKLNLFKIDKAINNHDQK